MGGGYSEPVHGPALLGVAARHHGPRRPVLCQQGADRHRRERPVSRQVGRERRPRRAEERQRLGVWCRPRRRPARLRATRKRAGHHRCALSPGPRSQRGPVALPRVAQGSADRRSGSLWRRLLRPSIVRRPVYRSRRAGRVGQHPLARSQGSPRPRLDPIAGREGSRSKRVLAIHRPEQ